VRTERMLPTELALGKSAVVEPTPHESFPPSVMLPQHARSAGHFGPRHAQRLERAPKSSQAPFSFLDPFPLTPALSHTERENLCHPRRSRHCAAQDALLPLPQGEGWGEGKGTPLRLDEPKHATGYRTACCPSCRR
jgi:hypothetical protein